MEVTVELTEKELRQLVLSQLSSLLGEIPLKIDEIRIEVKSKQNYKSEWEEAAFRARYVHRS